MEIQLDETTRLGADKYQYIIFKKQISKNTGEVTWHAKEFYDTLEYLFEILIERDIRASEVKQVLDLPNEVKNAAERLEIALKGYLEPSEE